MVILGKFSGGDNADFSKGEEIKKLNENMVEVENAKKKVREQFPFPGYLDNSLNIATNIARKKVREQFPFPGYIDNSLNIAANIASVIKKYLQPGAKILDFGSGSLDKTAVIQCLGYECSAFDDLQDEWYVLDDNVQRIKDFAKQFNIDFKHAADGYLPFEKESFDMVMSHDVLEHLHDSP